jgi:hypothetical protein
VANQSDGLVWSTSNLQAMNTGRGTSAELNTYLLLNREGNLRNERDMI